MVDPIPTAIKLMKVATEVLQEAFLDAARQLPTYADSQNGMSKVRYIEIAASRSA